MGAGVGSWATLLLAVAWLIWVPGQSPPSTEKLSNFPKLTQLLRQSRDLHTDEKQFPRNNSEEKIVTRLWILPLSWQL